MHMMPVVSTGRHRLDFLVGFLVGFFGSGGDGWLNGDGWLDGDGSANGRTDGGFDRVAFLHWRPTFVPFSVGIVCG